MAGLHAFHIDHIVWPVGANDLSLTCFVLVRSRVVFVSDHWVQVAGYGGGARARS